jgi:hypothetical protein
MRPLAFLAIVGFSGCATTVFQSTWRAPDAAPLRFRGEKVVALFVSKNLSTRHLAEDAMAREISARGAHGIPAYSVLGDEEIRDREAAKTKLQGMGFAGGVVMRIVGTETQYTYEPGIWARPYYRSFWGGYWGWGWGRVYEPGYLVADRVVSVETLVYSLKQDKLVWAGVSRTVDPSRIDSFIAELAEKVTERMARDGLLPKKS